MSDHPRHISDRSSWGLKSIVLATVLTSAIPGRGAADTTSSPASTFPFSPFGIGSCHQNGVSVEAYQKWIPQMSSIGLTVMRTPETSIWALEGQTEGVWKWDTLDAEMAYLDSQHFTYGALLYGSPKWNTLDKRGNLPVNNLPAWSEYVTRLATHVKGRIKYFEVWNEPPNGTGRDQTPEDYAKLVASSYDAVHAVDPTASVGIAAKSVDLNYLDRAILGPARDDFDYIVLHPYENLGVAMKFPGAEATFMNIVPTIRKMLAARDPARVNVPIWFTELGSDARKDPVAPAWALVKAYTMCIAQGVGCLSWFEGMDGDSGPMGLMTKDGTPRPAYTAMTQMIRLLGQHPSYLGLAMLNDKDYGFVFQGAKGTVMVAWAPVGTSDTLALAAPVTVIDPSTGNSTSSDKLALTSSPILIDGVPDTLVKKAQADKEKPFPWDGDYTNATSVSVAFGATNVEKGLHTQSAANVAADVILYGGSARSGTVPGGNVFMVDPNFLTYTSTPIEISVVVRRNPANDNAGFKLNYESTTGYKDLGWYTIPDNTEWHTVKWKIEDAQFVDMYGYNFSLVSDGNQFNKYEIQSVSVTKLRP